MSNLLHRPKWSNQFYLQGKQVKFDNFSTNKTDLKRFLVLINMDTLSIAMHARLSIGSYNCGTNFPPNGLFFANFFILSNFLPQIASYTYLSVISVSFHNHVTN